MSNFALQVSCGCRIDSYDYGKTDFTNQLTPCALHGSAEELLAACKAALNMPAPIDRRLVEQRLKAAIAKAEEA